MLFRHSASAFSAKPPSPWALCSPCSGNPNRKLSPHSWRSAAGHCWRYDRIEDALSQAGGRLSPEEALDLLGQVAQDGTQWSVVYDQHSGDVLVAMGRQYDRAHTLHLPLSPEP